MPLSKSIRWEIISPSKDRWTHPFQATYPGDHLAGCGCWKCRSWTPTSFLWLLSASSLRQKRPTRPSRKLFLTSIKSRHDFNQWIRYAQENLCPGQTSRVHLKYQRPGLLSWKVALSAWALRLSEAYRPAGFRRRSLEKQMEMITILGSKVAPALRKHTGK